MQHPNRKIIIFLWEYLMMNVLLGLPTLPCVLYERLMCEMESVD